MKKILTMAFIITLSLSLLTFAHPTKAALVSATLANKCGTGNCTLTDMVGVIANGMDWIFSIVGAAALLMFVYGGFTFLISAGNEEQVKKGKAILQGAIIGLIIVLGSYMIINFLLTSLGYNHAQFGTWYVTSEIAP